MKAHHWTALALLSACFCPEAVKESYNKGHDGSTVDGMLEKIGEGYAHFPSSRQNHRSLCDHTSCKEEEEAVEEKEEEEEEEEELCWGYERGCTVEKRLFVPRCDEPARPWSSDMEGKLDMFWTQGDFGYVKKEMDSLTHICSPPNGKLKKRIAQGGSLLMCSDQFKYCRARNLYMDLRRYRQMIIKEGKYRSFLEDIFEEGEIGGHCELDLKTLRNNGGHKSPLQSWYAELGGYSSLSDKVGDEICDEVVTQPTVFIKLDAVVNMYHHFCDFFNLYASQHINGSFSDDVQIIIWDTTTSKEFRDPFIEAWNAFTKHPIKKLAQFEGKRVCFKDAVFSLLARMQRGLYYNTYLIPGCRGSGLMQAFTKHLVPRLGIRREDRDPTRVRITLLSRSTKHRRFVNEDELVNAMKTVGYFQVSVVDYKFREFPFLDQIKMSHNSDIFMGIHGAGLTHMIFLPDWAGIFEMYNTDDPRCYHDLARLRGIEYITWEREDKIWKEAEGYSPTSGKASPKFTNYTLDVEEMMRLVIGLGDRVRLRKMEALSHAIFSSNN